MSNAIEGILGVSMEKIREMVDVNTIIGDPISAPNGTTIIPVSKVSFGFASGGSDLPTQAAEKFAGGAGAGVTVKPQAFIVIKTDGDVELLELGGAGKTSTGRRCRGYSGRYREDKGSRRQEKQRFRRRI